MNMTMILRDELNLTLKGFCQICYTWHRMIPPLKYKTGILALLCSNYLNVSALQMLLLLCANFGACSNITKSFLNINVCLLHNNLKHFMDAERKNVTYLLVQCFEIPKVELEFSFSWRSIEWSDEKICSYIVKYKMSRMRA